MKRRPLFVALAVLGVLALTEGVLRLVVPEEQLVFVYERPDGMLMTEGDGTFLPRPDTGGVVPDGPNHWTWRQNHQGLREDAEIPAEKPAGTSRWLALGDSWIWGANTDQSATIEAGLEALLPAKLGVAKVEVINAGVPGAAAYDMLVRWRDLRDDWQIDGLVLGAPKNTGRQKAVAAERALWYQGGGAPYLDLYLYLGLRRLLVPWTRASLRELGDDVVAAMVEDLVTLTKEARAAGLEVALGMWPQTRDAALSANPNVPYAAFANALTPLGAKVTGARLGSNACWGFQDTAHPSEAGYRVLAQVLAERIGGGPDPGGLRTAPRCEDVPGIGPTKSTPPRPAPAGFGGK